MDPLPGQRISDTVCLKRQIGEGGMASIWLAEDSSLGRDVAVKFLSPTLCNRDEAHERFHQEAGAIALIESPHVPKVYCEGTLPDGTPFIVMELLEGEDLEVYLTAHGPLSLSQTVLLLSQLASAVSAAHAVGIVHRDIKPENIFLTGPFSRKDHARVVTKLLDFGIAKVGLDDLRGMTKPGAILGTPSYMSPEQLLSSSSVDEKSDLWSLGVVAYLALTGRLPFSGESFGAVCVAIHSGTFPLVSVLRPELPMALDAWFQRALHPSPAARFRTARDLADALGLAAQRPSAMAILEEKPAHSVAWASFLEGASSRWRRPMPRARIVVTAAACAGVLTFWASGQSATAAVEVAGPVVAGVVHEANPGGTR
jgi:eukaryotic-like serine/threonine-protein kinase